MRKTTSIICCLTMLLTLFSGCAVREHPSLELIETTDEAPLSPDNEATPETPAVTAAIHTTAEPVISPMVTATPISTPTPTSTPIPSWVDLYEPVFANYRAVADVDLRDRNFDHSKDTYGVLGSWDLTTWQDVTYGYILRDLDRNGIPELIVGNMASADDNRIHSMFTLIDSQPQRILSSTTRSSYYLLNTGEIYHHGSSSAMWTDSMICSYSGTEITALYGCFSSDGSSSGIYDFGFYKVTNGDRYTGNAEKISQEEYGQYLESIEVKALPLDDLSLIWIF